MTRWNLASPGAGGVRGMDSILRTVAYMKDKRREDKRYEAGLAAQSERDAVDTRRYNEQMTLKRDELELKKRKAKRDELAFNRGDYAFGMKSFQNADTQEEWEALTNFAGNEVARRKETAPGTEGYWEQVHGVMKRTPWEIDADPTMSNMGGITESRQKNPAVDKLRDQMQVMNMAGYSAADGDLSKITAEIGSVTDEEKAAARVEAASVASQRKKDAAALKRKEDREDAVTNKKVKNQTFTDKDGNVTNVTFGEDGTVTGVEKVEAKGKPVGRAGKTSEPITIGEKVKTSEALQASKNVGTIPTPKFKEGAIDVAKKMMGAEWDTLEPEEKETKVLEEMDKQIKALIPEASYGMGSDGLGWYHSKTEKLIRLAN